MPASEREVPPARPSGVAGVAGVSMRDLLASCAAAEAVSRPPREPVPETRTAEARTAGTGTAGARAAEEPRKAA